MTIDKLVKILKRTEKNIIKEAVKDYGKEVDAKTYEDMKNYLWGLELYDSEHYAYDSGALGEVWSILKLIEEE